MQTNVSCASKFVTWKHLCKTEKQMILHYFQSSVIKFATEKFLTLKP